MKNWIIITFGLKGSWKWAKKQMMQGKMVRCKHWSGALKYRVSHEMVNDIYGENPKPSTLLQQTLQEKTNNLKTNSHFGKRLIIICLMKILQTMRCSSGSITHNDTGWRCRPFRQLRPNRC